MASEAGPRRDRGRREPTLARPAWGSVALGVVAVVAAGAAACFETAYRCRVDADCDVGEAGRCEPSGRCTRFDETCPAQRRYTRYSAELTEACFDDARPLANPCAGGQPPAVAEGCAREVCEALPACCETGWSDACAQAAQLRCAPRCDTRIAVTAIAGGRPAEMYDLRWSGTGWSAVRITDRDAALAWLGPSAGGSEPRLGGVDGTALVVEGRRYELGPGRTYQALASVDLDRDGRDTVALSSSFGMGPVQHAVDVIKLDDGTRRTLEAPRSQHLGWGDSDHDAFPDGVAGFNAGYAVLDNMEADDGSHARTLSGTTSSNVNNLDTPPSPPIRGFDWVDLDGDGRLELAVFGTQLRIHLGDVRFANTPVFNRDCDPPIAAGACATPEAVAFAGAALPALLALDARPGLDAPGVVVATFPARKVYRIAVDPREPATPVITALPDACPTCPPILALVARDLDGDRRLDVVGIDARLRIHTALAADGFTLRESSPIPPALQPFPAIDVSVSGAPISAP